MWCAWFGCFVLGAFALLALLFNAGVFGAAFEFEAAGDGGGVVGGGHGGGEGRLAAGGGRLFFLQLLFVVCRCGGGRSVQLGDADLPRRGVDLPRADASQAHRGNSFELDTSFIGGLRELHRRDGEGRFWWVPWQAVTFDRVKYGHR